MLEKKYNVYKNEAFKGWFYNQQAQGYQSIVNLDEINELILKLSRIGMIKYPDYNYDQKKKQFKVTNEKGLQGYFNFLLASDKKLLPLLKGYYRAKETICFQEDQEYDIKLSIRDQSIDDEDFNTRDIIANSNTGVIYNSSFIGLDGFYPSGMTLDQLLKRFQEDENGKYDYQDLKTCVKNHDCDLQLRKQIFDFATMRILETPKNPEMGYQRAKLFVEDLNKIIPNLKMSIEAIGEEVQKPISLQNKKKVKSK